MVGDEDEVIEVMGEEDDEQPTTSMEALRKITKTPSRRRGLEPLAERLREKVKTEPSGRRKAVPSAIAPLWPKKFGCTLAMAAVV